MIRIYHLAVLTILYLLFAAAAASGQATAEAVKATGPLIVTAPGYYSGTFTTASIRTTAPVTLNACHFTAIGADTISGSGGVSLRVTNCVFDGTPPHYSLVLWNVQSLDVEHCQLNGGGGMVCSGTTKAQIHFAYNTATNISGATSATTCAKTSFFQIDLTHTPDIYVGWNRCTNVRGKSAMEDGLSLMESGGTSASPAIIENNLIDGQYAWPAGSHSSGSCLMGYDPGSGASTDGGFTIVRNNNLLNGENVGLDVAGAHGVQVLNNTLTAHAISTTVAPARTWRWIGPGGGTPVHWFGPFIASGNQASWFAGTKKMQFIWAEPQTTATANTYADMTDQQNRDAWAAKVAAAGLVIGPVPPATSTVQALSYAASSAGIQNVPLPSEHLGKSVAVGWTTDKTFVRYSALDFGNGVSTWTASVACQNSSAGHTMELHLDSVSGPLVGTLKVVGTGANANGWYAFQPQSCAVSGGIGTHELFIVFSAPGSMQGVGNLQSFGFK